MNKIFIGRKFSILLILMLVSACSSGNAATPIGSASTNTPTSTDTPVVTDTPVATITPAETATPEAGLPITGSGQCVNAYYPVREGATWTYASTGGPTGGYGFTDTITSVREDGFTLTSQFGNLTRTQEWACRPEGLVALQLGGTSAATLNNDNMQVTLDVDNVSGVTYPATINPGDTWQHALEFTGTITVAGQNVTAKGDAQASFQAVDNESVTVPAGTFDALKIHVDTTININGNFNGVRFPVTMTAPYDYWFVQGVGWVKASGTGSLSGQSFSETIELQSYNIP
jgi:hypothetical protein